jgi:hypothetical protein
MRSRIRIRSEKLNPDAEQHLSGKLDPDRIKVMRIGKPDSKH